MAELELASVVDQLDLIGLISRDQLREARAEADDGSPEALIRVLLRKGWLTSWQLERIKKNDALSFFYGNYRAMFFLAEGTFARVYRGSQNDSGAPVAIKALRNRLANIPEAVARFHKEAEAGMRLRHENIVRILDQGQQENRHFIIMEFVEGMNLRELLRSRTRIGADKALPLMLGLARGLEYSHDQGVTHRDLKATNVLISNSGQAKLVDFGLATIEGDDSKHGVTSQRTVDYSALERSCNSPKGDPRSDIYFLGCVFYHMLTGQVPLEDSESKDPLKKMLKRSFGNIKPIGDHPYAPPEPLAAIVDRMMKVDVKARYQGMREVVAALEEYEASIDPAAAEAREFARKYEGPAISYDDVFLSPTDLIEMAPEAGAGAGGADGAEPEGGSGSSTAQRAIKGSARTVLCVETQAEIQDALRKNLSKLGYRALIVGDPERAAERYREAPTDAVLFDADGIGPQGMDAVADMQDRAEEDGTSLVLLLLLGPRQAALKDKLPEGCRSRVLCKPIKLKQVQEALSELLPVNA
ncbi:Serine/threonine-protein kinase StkP [Aquisphaera giovannonii]|uniref:Serine/threonine-protein kinase StkP n=1 Tax=Aquisphaera giovannonii TaxID=406548 RepID=A0A5B9WE39_9BACT|nr:serine/threonine-protein kinase [Aquisphaera giovannonii]QEH38489.1 Serine/threonine-protein kinase StkP [Aquisphaera giovannonii]